MKLMPMTDFVLEQDKVNTSAYVIYLKILNYAQFLKQPLTLGMFVPCDDAGNVLEIKNFFGYGRDYIFKTMSNEDLIKFDKYQQAKERVLFEGWKIIHQDKVRITIECDCFQLDWAIAFNNFYHYTTIENLSHLNFELTQSAIKQIGI